MEKAEQLFRFREGEEPGVRELERELATVGVVAPDSVERLATAESVVDGFVAVAHGVKHDVAGDRAIEVSRKARLVNQERHHRSSAWPRS